MRQLFFLLLATSLAAPLQSQSVEEVHAQIDALFREHVSDGLVDYSAISNAPDALNAILSDLQKLEIPKNDAHLEKALLINAYNIFVIKQVIDHYPIASPQGVGGFFTEKKFLIGSREVSLNQLEKDILLPAFPDGRLHFALVCAAKGCPKLRSEAYHSGTLEAQLEAQSKATLQDDFFASYDGETNTLTISKIFDWYASDFGQNDVEIIRFVNRYLREALPENAKIVYKEYDWTLNAQPTARRNPEEMTNLELFTPSALFNKGEFEVNVFNSIYSQQEIRDANREAIALPNTESFFTSWITFNTGLSKRSRINVGVDLFISKARFTPGDHSAFEVFNSNDDAVFNRTVFSYIAPRIKFVPFKKVPRMSVQSALWIPVRNDLESEGFIAHQRYTWFTQVFFDQNIWSDFQIFLEAALLYRFASVETQRYDFFRTPVSAFLSWFPTSKSTLFVFSQYSPRFENSSITAMDDRNMTEEVFGMTQWFVQFGVGAKYQITKSLGIEISYSDFSFSKQEGAGHTVNLGLRYIHR